MKSVARAKWLRIVLVVGAVASAAALLRCPAFLVPMAMDEERSALARQLRVSPDGLSLEEAVRSLRFGTVRTWWYMGGGEPPLGIIQTNGRCVALTAQSARGWMFVSRPRTWQSPVECLEGQYLVEPEAGSVGHQPQSAAPEPLPRDTAVMGLAALLGVPVSDGAGRKWQPRFTWVEVPADQYRAGVYVRLRLREARPGLPRVVRFLVNPPTGAVSFVVIDKW